MKFLLTEQSNPSGYKNGFYYLATCNGKGLDQIPQDVFPAQCTVIRNTGSSKYVLLDIRSLQ